MIRSFFQRTSETIRYALIGMLFGALFPVVATLIKLNSLGLTINPSNIIGVQATESLLWIIDTAPVFLGFFAALARFRQDRLLALNKRINQQNQELENTQATIEQRVKEQTQSLEQHAARLQFVAGAARQLAAVQDMTSLASDILKLIDAQFDHIQTTIFTVDDNREYVVPALTNTGEGQNNETLPARLTLDGTNIVGSTALLGELRLISDTVADFTFSNKISHPKTKAELSIPLRIREQAIGVLYLQSELRHAFSEENIDVLTIVADQIAVGINNARLYSEAKSALAESRETIAHYVRQEWNSFTKRAKQNGFIYDGRQVTPLNGQVKSDRARAISQTGSLSLDKTSANVTVPIKLRGLTIGILEVRPKKGKREWTDDELSLLEAAADRAAYALENARLVDSAQRRASRERAIGEISNKIGAISDRNLILQTAVEELGRRISNTEIIIEIENDPNAEDAQKA